jgi:hypothetical protein
MFRTGKCALASLYAVFRDSHTPARQFLIAALQGPVMAVLHEDEFFLDVDPDKAMERYSITNPLRSFEMLVTECKIQSKIDAPDLHGNLAHLYCLNKCLRSRKHSFLFPRVLLRMPILLYPDRSQR